MPKLNFIIKSNTIFQVKWFNDFEKIIANGNSYKTCPKTYLEECPYNGGKKIRKYKIDMQYTVIPITATNYKTVEIDMHRKNSILTESNILKINKIFNLSIDSLSYDEHADMLSQKHKSTIELSNTFNQELIKHIKTFGLESALEVEMQVDKNGNLLKYVVEKGNRRAYALKQLGWITAPCILKICERKD